jgi:hypothetical protein
VDGSIPTSPRLPAGINNEWLDRVAEDPSTPLDNAGIHPCRIWEERRGAAWWANGISPLRSIIYGAISLEASAAQRVCEALMATVEPNPGSVSVAPGPQVIILSNTATFNFPARTTGFVLQSWQALGGSGLVTGRRDPLRPFSNSLAALGNPLSPLRHFT